MKRFNYLQVEVNFPYYLVTNQKEYEKLTEDKHDLLPEGAGGMVVQIHEVKTNGGRPFLIVYLPLSMKGSQATVAAVISHEAMHVWQYMREKLAGPNRVEVIQAMWEMEAYMYDDIFFQLYRGYLEAKKEARAKKK